MSVHRWRDVAPAADGTPVKLTLREDPAGRVGMIRLPAGAVVPAHRHAADEVFVFVAGRACVVLDGVELRVGAGDVVCFPAGVEHSIVAGHREVRFVAVVAPNDEWSPR
jgi:quercetin dioxygenase-like cupin family protein